MRYRRRAIARRLGCWARTRTPCSGSPSSRVGVRKRKSGRRPRVQSLPSVVSRPNERRATDMTRVWCGEEHRWCALTVGMDCFIRELLSWRLSPTGNARSVEAALEDVLIRRYGRLGKARYDLAIRSDNGLIHQPTLYPCTGMRSSRTLSDLILRNRTGWRGA